MAAGSVSSFRSELGHTFFDGEFACDGRGTAVLRQTTKQQAGSTGEQHYLSMVVALAAVPSSRGQYSEPNPSLAWSGSGGLSATEA